MIPFPLAFFERQKKFPRLQVPPGKAPTVRSVNELPAILTVRDVASALRVSQDTVCAYIRRGDLRASGLGTTRAGVPCAPYAIRREDLVELLDRRAVSFESPTSAPIRPAPRPLKSRRSGRKIVPLVSAVEA